MLQVKEGKAKAHGSGYGGSGFKFNDQEEEAVKARKKVGQAGHLQRISWLHLMPALCLKVVPVRAATLPKVWARLM